MAKIAGNKLIPQVFSVLMAGAISILALHSTVPWFDEIVLADKPINWIMRGENYGYVCPCTYNLLFPLLETAWFRILGASHLSACALSVFFALVSSIVLLHILDKRGILRSHLGKMTFVTLFWGGWNMVWIVTNARPDTTVMLFTILLANELIPPADGKTIRPAWKSFLHAILLTLTAPNSMPPLFFLGVILLVLSSPERRKSLFVKGILIALGTGIAFAVMLAYYCIEKDLISFIGFYFQYNNATNGSSALQSLANAYRMDLVPVLMLTAASLAVLLQRQRAGRHFWLAVIFTALIPALMSVSRYTIYYSWIFYVPAAIILATTLSRLRNPAFCILTILIAMGSLCGREITQYRANGGKRTLYAACEKLIADNAALFAPGTDVVVTEDIHGACGGALYPVLTRGCRLWVRGPHILSVPDDETRIRTQLESVVPNREWSNRFLSYQRFAPQLPDSGIFLFPTAESRATILPILKDKGYRETSAPTPADGYPCFSTWVKTAY